MNKNIFKLKVIEIKPNGLIVQKVTGETGFIHISEIANTYIDDLKKYFEVNDIIYGQKIKTHYGKNYYSLKAGHTLSQKIQKKFKVRETGGGYLGILYYQNVKLSKEKRRKK